MIDKGIILTTLGVLTFSGLIALLVFNQQDEFLARELALNNKVKEMETMIEAQKKLILVKKDTVVEEIKQDTIQQEGESKIVFYPERFDPADKRNFRIYGLFKDENEMYDNTTLAKKFNVPVAEAIKKAEVEGKNWYIVPIKAVHFLKRGETATSLARKYYKNDAKMKLIVDFNKRFDADTWVYIPFD